MNTNFRNFAIWVIIALLLIALFNLFQNPAQLRAGHYTPIWEHMYPSAICQVATA